MTALFLALFLAAQSSPAAQQARDTRTWYQAYADAQAKIQKQDWRGALNDLDAATRLGAPRPARNVNFYGDVYRDYNPDYYRAMALNGLDRYDEADQALERVRQAQLITSRDRLNGEFTRLSTNVKASVQKLAAARANGAAPNGVSPNGVSPAGVNTANVNPANANPVAPQGVDTRGVVTQGVNTPGNAPVEPSKAPPVTGTNAANSVTQSPVQRPLSPELQKQADANRARAAAINARPPSPVQLPAPSLPVPGAPAISERTALLQYFSGDYASAHAALTQLASAPSPSGRTLYYLACSQVALVLTGQAPRTAIADAQQTFGRIGTANYLAPDYAVTSPRILRELGLQQ